MVFVKKIISVLILVSALFAALNCQVAIDLQEEVVSVEPAFEAEAGWGWLLTVVGMIVNPMIPPHTIVKVDDNSAITVSFDGGEYCCMSIPSKQVEMYIPQEVWDKKRPLFTIFPGAGNDGQGWLEEAEIRVNGTTHSNKKRDNKEDKLSFLINADEMEDYCLDDHDKETYQERYGHYNYSDPRHVSYTIEIVGDSTESNDKMDPDFTVWIHVVPMSYFEEVLLGKVEAGQATVFGYEGEVRTTQVAEIPSYDARFVDLPEQGQVTLVPEQVFSVQFDAPSEINMCYLPEGIDPSFCRQVLTEYAFVDPAHGDGAIKDFSYEKIFKNQGYSGSAFEGFEITRVAIEFQVNGEIKTITFERGN